MVTFLTVVHGDYFWAKFITDSCYKKNKRRKTLVSKRSFQSLAIHFFKKKFKKMKIHHRKHKKCGVLNTLHLRSLVFPARLDWENKWFCKTGVATTTIPTTFLNIFSRQNWKNWKNMTTNLFFQFVLSDFGKVNMALYTQEVHLLKTVVFSM